MSKITRAFQAIFGSSGSIGVFGSAAAGSPTDSTSLSTIQSLAAWAAGWLSATLGGSKFPAIEDMNAVTFVTTTQLAYLFQQGIPEWDTDTVYYAGGIATNPGTFQIYGSLTNGNTGHALTDPTNWQLLVDFSNFRMRLTANTTFYVATTGNDSTGKGTLAAPWLTIQHAVDYINNTVDTAGFTATIQVADGTYTNTVTLGTNASVFGGGLLVIQGNAGTPSNCIISTTSADCIDSSGGNCLITGFKLQTATAGNCIAAQGGANITMIGPMVFGACAGSHIQVNDFGEVGISNNYTISGGAVHHINAFNNGRQTLSANPVITLTGTPAFSGAVVSASLLGSSTVAGITFTGAATGVRYSATLNSVINSNGGGANFIPGNSAGSVSTGGVYA